MARASLGVVGLLLVSMLMLMLLWHQSLPGEVESRDWRKLWLMRGVVMQKVVEVPRRVPHRGIGALWR